MHDSSILVWVIRYGFLLQESIASQDPLSVSVAILHQFDIVPEMYQVGYTKLFFRTGQVNLLFFLWILIALLSKGYLGFEDFKPFTAARLAIHTTSRKGSWLKSWYTLTCIKLSFFLIANGLFGRQWWELLQQKTTLKKSHRSTINVDNVQSFLLSHGREVYCS